MAFRLRFTRDAIFRQVVLTFVWREHKCYLDIGEMPAELVLHWASLISVETRVGVC